MKLRWFQTCDELGKKTAPVLQYWDDHYFWDGEGMWIDIGFVECKDSEEDDYLRDGNACNNY